MIDEKIMAEFEAWADGQGYDLERNDLVFYEAGATRCAFDGWRAARASVVIELPDWDQYDDDMTAGASAAIADCREAIRVAGLPVRP